MSVKVGDRVFIGPGTVYWLSDKTPETCHPGIALSLYAAAAKQHEVHPWHDALPAVAEWLAEHGAGMLRDLLDVAQLEIEEHWRGDVYGDVAYRRHAAQAARALLSALEDQA